MARPLTEAENIAIVQLIIDRGLVGAKLQTIQDAVFEATRLKVSIRSGKLTHLRNEAAAKVQTATEATACQMREKEIKALDNAIDTIHLIDNLAKLTKEMWDRISDETYTGPIPKWKTPSQYLDYLRQYNTLVANLAQFRPPPPPAPTADEFLPSGYKEGHIKDVMAAIEEDDDAFYQPWLSSRHTKAGGVKRARAEKCSDIKTPEKVAMGN